MVKIAIGSQDHPIVIGNFKGSYKNNETNIYYNIELGAHRKAIFDTNAQKYENLRDLHLSVHDSGKVHIKFNKKPCRLQPKGGLVEGWLSDGSFLINETKDPIFMGIESFCIDQAPSGTPLNEEFKLLTPPGGYSKYSIVWMFVPSEFPMTIPNRFLWNNQYAYEISGYTARTASFNDVLITPEMVTIFTINGWDIRVCFLKTLLSFEQNNDDIILVHPKGKEKPWRAYTFIDCYLPLARMLAICALKKKPILLKRPLLVSVAASHPSAWVKYASGRPRSI